MWLGPRWGIPSGHAPVLDPGPALQGKGWGRVWMEGCRWKVAHRGASQSTLALTSASHPPLVPSGQDLYWEVGPFFFPEEL